MVAFVLVPFFTHYMSPDQFGVQQLFYIGIAVGTELLLLGLDVALLRFYVLEKDAARRKVIFSTVWITSFVCSTLFAAIVWLEAPRLVRLVVDLPLPTPDWAIYTLRICVGIFWLEILNALPFMILRGEGKALHFTMTKISGAVLQTGFTLIALISLKRGVAGVFEANLASSMAVALMLAPAVTSRLRPVFDRAMLSACLKFGLPNVPNAMFVLVIDFAGRKSLEIFCGAGVTGLYSVGHRLGTFLAIVVAGFRFAWQPFFLSISNRPDAKQVYGKVLSYYFVVMVWLYLLLTAFVIPLAKWDIPGIGVLIAPEFWDGLGVFPIVLLAHLFNGAYAIFMVGIYMEKKTFALPFITGTAGVINIAGNIYLIPIYGMWAAAWLTVLSYAVMTILLYFYIQRYYPIVYEWWRIVRIALLGGLFFAASWAFSNGSLPALGWSLALLFPVPAIYFTLTGSERRKLMGFIHKQ
jgi:O-antigen/teichoic acid export membrane protein